MKYIVFFQLELSILDSKSSQTSLAIMPLENLYENHPSPAAKPVILAKEDSLGTFTSDVEKKGVSPK